MLATTSLATEDSATSRYLAGLRQRHLFRLAEGFCLDSLKRQDLTARRRALLTLEYARTCSAHAEVMPPEEASDLWQQAGQVIDDHLQKNPETADRLRFEFVRAQIPAARGSSLRWQVELRPWDEELRNTAMKVLAAAATELKSVDGQISAALKSAIAGRSPRAGQIPAYELRTLRENLRLQLATVLTDTARLRKKDDPERTAALLEADERLRPLSGGRHDAALTMLARLQLAEVTRLRGDMQGTGRMLDALEQEEELPPELADRVAVHRIRWLLESGHPVDAAEKVNRHHRSRGELSGELAFLQVQSTLALRQVALDKDDQELADELQTEARNQAVRIEHHTGGFWAWRAARLLQETTERQRYGRTTAPLIRQAEGLYARGDIDGSLTAYEQAAAEAQQAENTTLAAELRFTAASVLLQAGRPAEAAAMFLRVAEQSPDADRAATSHLLHAWSLGQVYNDRRTRRNREAYTRALEEHRSGFAEHPSRFDAVWMLGLLAERRLQISQALQLYLRIPPDHRRSGSARVAVARCFEAILRRLRQQNQNPVQWEQTALSRLRQYTTDLPAPPQDLSRDQAELALRTARIALQPQEPDYRYAYELVVRVVNSAPSKAAEPDQTPAAGGETAWPELVRMSRQLQIVCLAGLGQPREARALIDQLTASSVEDVLAVLNGLSRTAETVPATTRRALGDLQLAAGRQLEQKRDRLTPAQQDQLDRSLAEACLATNQPTRAIVLYQRLTGRHPDDRELHETAARQLARFQSTESLTLARKLWRRVESMHRPGSRAWLSARYEVAAAAFQLRDYEESGKLVKLVQVLYPGLGDDPALQERYDQLGRAIRRARDEAGSR